MRKTSMLAAALAVVSAVGFLASGFRAPAIAAASPDSIIKGSQSTLYYYAADGNRYVFPNDKIFFSWFNDFGLVQTVSDAVLAGLPLRGNVVYRPGVRLVKLQTDPKTYAVDRGGVLRWVQTEAAAVELYGARWNQNIDDVPDAFFFNYSIGLDIAGLADFQPQVVADEVVTINTALSVSEGAFAPRSNTTVGRQQQRLATDLAPDLIPLAPYDLRFDTLNGRTLLRFTGTFWNSGDGALELVTSPTTSGDENLVTSQKIWQKDGSTRQTVVGEFLWHAEHDHYHYANFADYALYPATAADFKADQPTVTQKTTFCLRDDLAINTGLAGAPRSAVYVVCGKTRQGVSVGWADRYPANLPDQWVDVTDVAPGFYRLSIFIDPDKRFLEKSMVNNVSATIIELNPAARTVRVVASGAAYATASNSYPDGMLVRADDDQSLYVINGNTKRLLANSAVISSYGYAPSSAIVLPRGVINAISNTKLIRLSGNSTVYLLNDAGYRRKILTPEILASYGLANSPVADVNATEFATYPETDLIALASEEYVYSIRARRVVALTSNMVDLGYDPASLHIVNKTDLNALAVEVVTSNLTVPWDIVFLPDGDFLVTERPGTLRRIGATNAVIDIPTVKHVGEGGLMGLALHPDFASNDYVYLYFTSDDGGQSNRIVRFTLNGSQLVEDRVILDNIPSSLYHDGGQIAFGPDGMLYVTTGDASKPELAQDLGSLGGKTLRLLPDGGIPADNPFGTAVWSYGHRNAQGIAWDAFGRMWQTEHGRSGALSGYDELNLVEKGKNYGWPLIQGGEQRAGMVTPQLHSSADYTWAPSGIAFVNGTLYFAGLRGSELYSVEIRDNGSVGSLEKHLSGAYGRLRAVVEGPDGALYVTTSNRDSRGTPRANDDKILRVYPDLLRP